mmetsp:Transcript_19374/g.63006  ORF Transcript_19374/g.63006 Transcript_19374/m.63006 type:complete len:182 (+) Transcript_19374:1-546(+)
MRVSAETTSRELAAAKAEAAEREAEATALRAQRNQSQEATALRAQLEQAHEEAARLRQELSTALPAPGATVVTMTPSPAGAGAAPSGAWGVFSTTPSNKKVDDGDDDDYDVEAAMLSGGGGGFQPLAPRVRTATAPCLKVARPVVSAAAAIDRLSVVLHRRPALRFALVLYMLILHLYAVL